MCSNRTVEGNIYLGIWDYRSLRWSDGIVIRVSEPQLAKTLSPQMPLITELGVRHGPHGDIYANEAWIFGVKSGFPS